MDAGSLAKTANLACLLVLRFSVSEGVLPER